MVFPHKTFRRGYEEDAGVRVVSKQQEYLLNVEQCYEMAALSGDDKHRQTLLAMSRIWRDLAAEEERIADLVRAVDELFPPKVDRPTPEKIQTPGGLVHRLGETLLGKKALRKTANGNSRSQAQVSSADTEAMRQPRWISKRIFTVQEVSE